MGSISVSGVVAMYDQAGTKIGNITEVTGFNSASIVIDANGC